MDRVVHAVTHGEKMDLHFLHKLDIDIRYHCRRRSIRYPDLEHFFNPIERLIVIHPGTLHVEPAPSDEAAISGEDKI
jgi:hypothetical protein